MNEGGTPSGTDLSHSDNGVFTPVPYSLDVDVLGKVPDLFFGHERVVVGWVHDPGVVELFDINRKEIRDV
jgi:hypothetical protein